MKTEIEQEVLHERLTKEQRELDAENGIIRKGELARIDRAYQDLIGDSDDMPPHVLEVGQQVIYYTHAKAVENWYLGRITMLDPAVGNGEFVVKRSKILVDSKYTQLYFADILELDEVTAVNLMKAGIVSPVDPKAWRP
jgi:hypothetical protein